ncbi:hypothetical protein TorRG33x02_344260, partial [Trema orientale]
MLTRSGGDTCAIVSPKNFTSSRQVPERKQKSQSSILPLAGIPPTSAAHAVAHDDRHPLTSKCRLTTPLFAARRRRSASSKFLATNRIFGYRTAIRRRMPTPLALVDSLFVADLLRIISIINSL